MKAFSYLMFFVVLSLFVSLPIWSDSFFMLEQEVSIRLSPNVYSLDSILNKLTARLALDKAFFHQMDFMADSEGVTVLVKSGKRTLCKWQSRKGEKFRFIFENKQISCYIEEQNRREIIHKRLWGPEVVDQPVLQITEGDMEIIKAIYQFTSPADWELVFLRRNFQDFQNRLQNNHEEMKALLQSLQKSNQNLQEKMEGQHKQIRILQEAITSQTELIKNGQQKMDAQEKQIKNLQEQIASQTNLIHEVQQKLQTQQVQIKSLQEVSVTHDKKLDTQEENLTALLHKLENALGIQQRQIKSLQEQTQKQHENLQILVNKAEKLLLYALFSPEKLIKDGVLAEEAKEYSLKLDTNTQKIMLCPDSFYLIARGIKVSINNLKPLRTSDLPSLTVKQTQGEYYFDLFLKIEKLPNSVFKVNWLPFGPFSKEDKTRSQSISKQYFQDGLFFQLGRVVAAWDREVQEWHLLHLVNDKCEIQANDRQRLPQAKLYYE